VGTRDSALDSMAWPACAGRLRLLLAMSGRAAARHHGLVQSASRPPDTALARAPDEARRRPRLENSAKPSTPSTATAEVCTNLAQLGPNDDV
jgi:hypothetical protein